MSPRRLKWSLAYLALIILQVVFAVALVLHGCRTASPGLNDDVEFGEKLKARVPIRKWEYIVVHHSATTEGNAERFDRYHRQNRGWPGGLGYHFVIGNGHGSGDGEIETGPRWINQQNGAHAGSNEYNKYGIGVCLVGDFTNTYPTERQMEALLALCRGLMRRCDIKTENVIGHGEIPGAETKCPGALFSMSELRSKLKRE